MDPPAVAGSSRQSSSSSSEIVQIDVETETAAVVDAEAVECAVDPAAVVGVAPPLTEEEIRSDAWAFLKDFFVLVEKRPDNFKTYQCILCKPKVKHIKAHASTMSHLKLHVSRAHGNSLKNFEDTVNQHSRRGKRPSGDDSKLTSTKKQSQQSIAAWASGAGSGALQSGVDRRIVDFFVGNMLALQVRYYFFALLIK